MERAEFDAEGIPAATNKTPRELEDRRKFPRYVPALDHAYLGWWEGEVFRTEPGWVENISCGGAALDVETDPGAGATVWLCVVGPERTVWVSARLLERRGRIVRLEFLERFPHQLFRTVVWGLGAQEQTDATHGVGTEATAASDSLTN